jgi:ERCC4-type nuclease
MVYFFIDNREAILKDRLMQTSWAAEAISLVNLDIGDVVVSTTNIATPDDMLMVFERKTLADLSASIKDGRHHEQKARLLEWRRGGANRRVYYIIEGFNALTNDDKTQTSSIINTLFRDDITVLLMRDVTETVAFLIESFTRFLEDSNKYFDKKEEGEGEDAYVLQVKMKKNKNITPENVFIYQLSQIPGISAKIAMGIAAVYSTMSEFVRALDAIETPIAKAHHVENIPVGPGRKIGKKTAIKIIAHI